MGKLLSTLVVALLFTFMVLLIVAVVAPTLTFDEAHARLAVWLSHTSVLSFFNSVCLLLLTAAVITLILNRP